MLVNSGKINTIRDVVSSPPADGIIGRPPPPACLIKWYYSSQFPMSLDLFQFPEREGQTGKQNFHYGYINHPMHCFFLAHCLVELQKFGSHALPVVKTLCGNIRADKVNAISEEGSVCPFAHSPVVLMQEALALYAIRDYDSSQVLLLRYCCPLCKVIYYSCRVVLNSCEKKIRTAWIISIRSQTYCTSKNSVSNYRTWLT